MKKTLVVLLALVSVFCTLCLTACGSDADVAGTYKFQSMTMTYNGQTQTVNVGEEYGGVILDENFNVLELKEDGTAKSSTTLDGDLVDESTGTWVKDGNNIVVTIDGESITAKIDGDTLTMEAEEDGYSNKVVLKK